MNNFGQSSGVKKAFLEKWDHSADYLLAIASSIPEDSLGYSPTERQMTIEEQLLHIRSNMLWLGNTYFNPESREMPDARLIPESREELLAALKEGFTAVNTLIENLNEETLSEEVEFFAGPKNRLQILNLMQDHVTHHRGQLIVYLNLLGIEPPRYSGW